MTIEHKDIADPNRHEPKGASTATANTKYVSDGLGSGSWRKTRSTDLQGLTGDGGNSDRIVVTDGANGFKMLREPLYGTMAITSNGVNFPLTAVADTTFNTASQFTLVTGTGAPWLSENLNGITFTTDRLTVPVTGIYKIDTYLNIGGFPGPTAKVALRYRINGGGFSSRKPTVKASSAGDEAQLVGFGLISLTASDYLQLYVATDTTGNLLMKDVNVLIQLVRQTA